MFVTIKIDNGYINFTLEHIKKNDISAIKYSFLNDREKQFYNKLYKEFISSSNQLDSH